MSQTTLSQTDVYFETLEQLTAELSDTYREMVDSLDELWKNSQALYIEKMRMLVEECREKIEELQIVRSQANGYFNEIDQANEIIEQLKNVIQ